MTKQENKTTTAHTQSYHAKMKLRVPHDLKASLNLERLCKGKQKFANDSNNSSNCRLFSVLNTLVVIFVQENKW